MNVLLSYLYYIINIFIYLIGKFIDLTQYLIMTIFGPINITVYRNLNYKSST